MKAPVPKGKMSRKARGQEDRKLRVTWSFSPVSRRKESGKVYKRQRIRLDE